MGVAADDDTHNPLVKMPGVVPVHRRERSSADNRGSPIERWQCRCAAPRRHGPPTPSCRGGAVHGAATPSRWRNLICGAANRWVVPHLEPPHEPIHHRLDLCPIPGRRGSLACHALGDGWTGVGMKCCSAEPPASQDKEPFGAHAQTRHQHLSHFLGNSIVMKSRSPQSGPPAGFSA